MRWKKRYDIETFLINRVLNIEHFHPKTAENGHQKLVPDQFLVLLNNPKQSLYARNYFEKKIS